MTDNPTDKELFYIAESLRPLAVPIDSIHIDPDNARKHSLRNADAIKNSILRFGIRKPIVVNKSTMVCEAGNGLLSCLYRLAENGGGFNYVPVVFVDDEKHTAKAYAIADNRTGDLSDWNITQLTSDLNELEEDLLLATGYTKEELDALLPEDGEELDDGEDDENEEFGGARTPMQKTDLEVEGVNAICPKCGTKFQI